MLSSVEHEKSFITCGPGCFALVVFLVSCIVGVLCLFLMVPWVGLQRVIGISWSKSLTFLLFLHSSCILMQLGKQAGVRT